MEFSSNIGVANGIATLFFLCLSIYFYIEMNSFKKRASRKKQMIADLKKYIQMSKENRGFSVLDRSIVEDDLNLNRRQREVLALMLDGLGNKQIAKSLCIEVSTVKYHITNIYRAYDVHCRQGLFDKLLEDRLEASRESDLLAE